MRTLLILTFALMMGAPMAATAQSDEAGTAAEEAAEREALREELEAARREVAEAARKLARIQRQLADVDMETVRVERLRALEEMEDLEGLEGRLAGMEERIHREVIRGLRMSRPRLGVLLGGDDDPNRIVGVTPGSGAEKAGIQAGDRLISINGQGVDVSESGSVRAAMEGVEPGDSVPVEVERDGESMRFDVTVSSPARDFRVLTHDVVGAPPAPGAPGAPAAPRIDREVIVLEGDRHFIPEPPLPPGLAGLGRHSDMISNHAGLEAYFGTAEGVVVLRIDDDNPLELRDGDVVLSIDGEAVSRPVEIGRVLLGRGGETVSLEIMRDGERLTFDAELPESRGVSIHIPGLQRGL